MYLCPTNPWDKHKSGGTLLSHSIESYCKNRPFLADYLLNIRNRTMHNANNSWQRCIYDLQTPGTSIKVVERCYLILQNPTAKTDLSLADYQLNIRHRTMHNVNHYRQRCICDLQTPGTSIKVVERCYLILQNPTAKTDPFLA